MRRMLIALVGAGLTLLGVLASDPASAQVDRNSATERACKARYDDIFANLNGPPGSRKITNEEISWALDLEQRVQRGEPCTLEMKKPAVPNAPAPKPNTPVSTAQTQRDRVFERGMAAYRANDLVAARKDFALACDVGSQRACQNLAVMAYAGQGGPVDLPLRRKSLGKACSTSSPKTCHEYARMLKEGLGGPVDQIGALKNFEIGCSANLPESCFGVGFALRSGNEQSWPRARALYKKACDAKIGDACQNLGLMMLDGEGGAKDPVGARASFLRACEYDLVAGCRNAGNSLFAGEGGPVDKIRAAEAYRKACMASGEEFDAPSCYQLAWINEELGDPVGARSNYERSCAGEFAQGCTNLGASYYRGTGGPRDPAKALDYFVKACDMGNEIGCRNKARLEARGIRRQ